MRKDLWRQATPIFGYCPQSGGCRRPSPARRPCPGGALLSQRRHLRALREKSGRCRKSATGPFNLPDNRPPNARLAPLLSRLLSRRAARPRRQRAPTGVGEAYARDMRSGRWPFTGDPIRFTTDGELIDGQHRLHAVIEADLTIPFLCVFGLEPRAKHALDTGRKRSAGDVLALKGYPQAARLSGAARQLLYIKHNTLSARVTSGEIEDIVERHPKLAECTHMFNNTRDISPSLLTALYYLLAYKMDEDACARDLVNAMRSVEGLRPSRLLFKAGLPA